jgi:hypothetical protein
VSVETTVTKDPESKLTYGFDWGAAGWLVPGETIAESDWVITAPAGYASLKNEGDTFSSDTTVTTVWLSGGIPGVTYRVTNKIVTTPSAFTDRRSFLIRIESH